MSVSGNAGLGLFAFVKLSCAVIRSSQLILSTLLKNI